jgi:hypothetical protein
MNKKNTQEYINNTFRNFQKCCEILRIKTKKVKINYSGITLAYLSKLEKNHIELLRRTRNLSRSKLYDKFNTDMANIKSELNNGLYDVRVLYISIFGKLHNYSITENDISDILNISEYDKLKVSVRDLIYKKIVGDIIPEHPKDEFRRARLLKRHFVIHCGETNTGKTYHALEAIKAANTGVYLAPLRLLALQVFQTLNENGVWCTLSTGEEDIVVPGAMHISSTIEKLNLDEEYNVAVIDEAQMIADQQRGCAWTKAILGALSPMIHVCCSPNAVNLLIRLIKDCGDSYEINKYNRDTELVLDEKAFTFPRSVKPGDALIAFSKRSVLNISSILAEKNKRASVIYGDLPPEARRNQMKLFISGETDIVVTTDALGMGLNLPIKRVVFMETKKFDGEESRKLKVNEIKQISGRAGRKNIYDIGYVNSINDKDYIGTAINSQLPNLDTAYYIPLEKYVLDLPMGSLEERLQCCMDARGEITYIHKADIEQPLRLLRIIEKERLTLTIEEMCKLIFIPFDAENHKLIHKWRNYIETYINNSDFIFPTLESEKLEDLEFYYKSLDLYYSFCKTMNRAFNKEEMMSLKYSTSDKIHNILKTNIKKMGNKCKKCGKKLEWNFKYKICESCYGLESE